MHDSYGKRGPSKAVGIPRKRRRADMGRQPRKRRVTEGRAQSGGALGDSRAARRDGDDQAKRERSRDAVVAPREGLGVRRSGRLSAYAACDQVSVGMRTLRSSCWLVSAALLLPDAPWVRRLCRSSAVRCPCGRSYTYTYTYTYTPPFIRLWPFMCARRYFSPTRTFEFWPASRTTMD